jgi:hypothetical protein
MNKTARTVVNVDIASGREAIKDVCVYPAPKPFGELDKLRGRWLVLEGPRDGSDRPRRRLVGVREADDAEDSTAVWVTPALFRAVAPDAPAGAIVAGTVSSASRREVVSLMGLAGIGKALGATLVFAAVVTGAIAAFVTSETGIGIAALILAIIVGLIAWKAAIRDTFTPNCGSGK